ncbi:MAG: leucyl/phenylalanyl-tRNA--protein transferase [Gammaproteobacteria bacterium]|nr:MAG: leucyl/phenylalanyl-tRNA--protein transferase [Gammaproteobacteria bacterium]
MHELTLLDDINPAFPHPDNAMREPDGLLAVGGNLSTSTLLSAYRQGIFPWYESGQPLLWWSPDPRAVLFPEQIRISRSLRKSWRRSQWSIRIDSDFSQVVKNCAAPRSGELGGTWITPQMQQAYLALHRAGHAHSVEVWDSDQLVGGLYGVLVGNLFCGESMFSFAADASKVALVVLAGMLQQYSQDSLIDCQISNDHLVSMGSTNIPRREFLARLVSLRDKPFNWNAADPADGLSKLK